MLTEIGGQLGWLASEMSFDFKSPVYIGDTIECRYTITEMDDRGRTKADVRFLNQKGNVVVKALVSGITPGPREIEVLEAMLAEGDPTNKAAR